MLHSVKPVILWGRFGGLSKLDTSKISKRSIYHITYEPFEMGPNGLANDGSMSIIQLLSRAWDTPQVDLEGLSGTDGRINLKFRNSSFYGTARLLYDLHYKRHFIRFGWFPATNQSLESFNINTEFISHFLEKISPAYILFETPPHNAFDTLLYFVSRTIDIPCYVARDNGYLGGFRLYVNPLDTWPHSTFQELLIPPSQLIQNFRDAATMRNDIRMHTEIIHKQLSDSFFPGKGINFPGLWHSFMHISLQKILRRLGFRKNYSLLSEQILEKFGLT